MVELPPVAPLVGLTARVRLARDYYVRVDGCDYSVDPRVIGRFVEVTASATQVEVRCEGRVVAAHRRCWGRQLIASRYEQGSVLLTSNLPFGRWGETFSDDVVAGAMIDRLVHHAEVLTLTGDSYRTRHRRELLAKQNRAQRD